MSKEIEALEGMFDLITSQGSFEKAQKYFNIIEEALQRLESIDNANPSEALECLESIQLYSADYYDGIYSFEKEYNVIKNYILKAQEPKHYLKWEDLEFKKEEQTIKVRLNGTEYDMKYFDTGDFEFIMLQNDKYNAVAFSDYCNKQFFNDLRLERLEE